VTLGGNEMESEMMNECPYRSSCYVEDGFDGMSRKWFKVAKSLGTCESVCTCPRHKKSQLYELYVRWTSKLSLLSLFAAVNKNIYQRTNDY
jgi:hypothetical protein